MTRRIPLEALTFTLFVFIGVMTWYALLGGQLPREPEMVVEVAR